MDLIHFPRKISIIPGDLVSHLAKQQLKRLNTIGVITPPRPNINFNLIVVENREWMSNYIQHKTMDAISYPCSSYPGSAMKQCDA